MGIASSLERAQYLDPVANSVSAYLKKRDEERRLKQLRNAYSEAFANINDPTRVGQSEIEYSDKSGKFGNIDNLPSDIALGDMPLPGMDRVEFAKNEADKFFAEQTAKPNADLKKIKILYKLLGNKANQYLPKKESIPKYYGVSEKGYYMDSNNDGELEYRANSAYSPKEKEPKYYGISKEGYYSDSNKDGNLEWNKNPDYQSKTPDKKPNGSAINAIQEIMSVDAFPFDDPEKERSFIRSRYNTVKSNLLPINVQKWIDNKESNLKGVAITPELLARSLDNIDIDLSESEQQQVLDFLIQYRNIFPYLSR